MTINWHQDSQLGKCLDGGNLYLERNDGLSLDIFCEKAVLDIPDTKFIYLGNRVYKGALSGIAYHINDNGEGKITCVALHKDVQVELNVSITNYLPA